MCLQLTLHTRPSILLTAEEVPREFRVRVCPCEELNKREGGEDLGLVPSALTINK